MCGICGEIDFKKGVVGDTIRKMCKVLEHRGPDDMGVVLFRGGQGMALEGSQPSPSDDTAFEVGLGHRRLSIIDLSKDAHQPMGNEDGTVWIVFNGEIYNFLNIKEKLEKKGHRFRSKSDTEVILHAYEEWDVDCLSSFRGMFAFSIWDSKRKRLFMARDRLGEKPLVYFSQAGRFLFASEIKSILQAPDIEKRVDLRALHHYLTFQYVPSPDTIFEGIKKLPPAHYLLYDGTGEVRIERYWKLQFASNGEALRGSAGFSDLIRGGLEESVRLRLVSDVPIGVFLSGGVDSSLVVGIMAKVCGNPVKTFSIGFEEKEFDELSHARLVSELFSTEHHEFVVRPKALDVLPKLVWHYNEPFADSSAIPTYYLSKMTSDYVKVVLTGDAGDENFAGYRRYLRNKWVSLFTRIPQRLRRDLFPPCLRLFAGFHWKEKELNRLADFIESLSASPARNYGEQVKIFNDREKESIYSQEVARELEKIDSMGYLLGKYDEAETDDLLEKLLYVDINSYLPEDLLVKMDIASMANSLEARAPFLDHEFMELAARVPSRLKLKGLVPKFILKDSFSDLLPKAILDRRKMGFAVPVARWLRGELKDYAYGILLDRRTLTRGYLRGEGIKSLLDEHVALRYDHSAKIWALLVLEIWFRMFMDGKGDATVGC